MLFELLNSYNNSVCSFFSYMNKLDILFKNKEIILYWILSHIGIQGNEKSDKAAKKSLNIDLSNTKKYTMISDKHLIRLLKKNGNSKVLE